MMKIIEPNEVEIVGVWELRESKVVADLNAKRIEWLIESHLQKIAGFEWETLYKDPQDGRFWELTYPHSEWHGGGPPKLKSLSPTEAREKYKII